MTQHSNFSACMWRVLPAIVLFLGISRASIGQDVVAANPAPPASAAPNSAHVPDASTPTPHLVWCAPFVLILLAIAILPLIPRFHHTWELNRVKLAVGLVLGGIVLIHYATRGFGIAHDGHVSTPGLETVRAVLHHAILGEYVPFVTFLFGLYVIAGGIQMRGDIRALPSVNTAFLAAGTLLASFVGTTGASMMLIRPLLQTNQERTKVVHTVIFFIFLVSNIGGSLLPLGDPPLFLGYLRGVPFFWTLSLWPAWLFCSTVLLLTYYLWDRLVFWPREPLMAQLRDRKMIEPLRVRGAVNFVWLIIVIAAVALMIPGKPLPGTRWLVPQFAREAVILAITGLSLLTTPKGLRKESQFSYGAILEVAALFLGIFLTMQVPMEILHAEGSRLGLHSSMQFFWWTGALSSFLDNAPTYLVFLATAQTLHAGGLHVVLNNGVVATHLLQAISLGAVFMGANTYSGNGPNFMVKSIAERQGVKMPSFFGYLLYSGLILIPLFIAVSILFLKR